MRPTGSLRIGPSINGGGRTWPTEVPSAIGASAYIIGHVNGGCQDENLPPLRFQDQVALWLEVWTVDTPELREQARAVVDPNEDPWGYLAALRELILTFQ